MIRFISSVVSFLGAVGLVCLAVPQCSFAEEGQTSTKQDLQTVQFVLHPARPPYAAMKYRLLPKGIERTPGNAAPHYFRATLIWGDNAEYRAVVSHTPADANSKLEDWLELPLDQLNKNQQAQDFYNSCPTGNWDLINLAARREQCEWDLPIREFNIATLIPELQKLRDLGRLLVFKARIEISRGQIDQAMETLKTGMAIAQHAAQGPTLINALVGAALTRMTLNQVAVLIQQPNCPNLYWTLTAVPSPIVDLRSGLDFESDFVFLFLPELRDVKNAVHTELEWDKLLLEVADKLVKVLPGVSQQPKDLTWYGMGAMFAITAYPKAKVQLREAGYSEAKIKAMPISQAILTAEVETFQRQSNDMHKWFYVDSPSALKGLDAQAKDFETWTNSKQEIIPLASLLLPALHKVKTTEVLADREVAALRCVEAIRWYAAEHKDQLPTQLTDIKEAPVPQDPSTGKPFEYVVQGALATLTSPAPAGKPAVDGLRWEITLAATKK